MSACRNVVSKREERSGDIIRTAKKYIEDHFDKDISLDDVSRVVNISPYYFSKVFKEESGLNFIEYLTNIRIDKAKELLLSTSKKSNEIGAMVGYKDPHYFSYLFKKTLGMTTTQYRSGMITSEDEE